MSQFSQSSLGLLVVSRQARESKEALDLAKAKEAAAEATVKEANSKLAGLVAREQAVADYKDHHAAALQAKDAADQVCFSGTIEFTSAADTLQKCYIVRLGKVLCSCCNLLLKLNAILWL